ncbi:MAG: hypothetical protein NDJ90_05505 [Oligoflexia bacterium]|nr:hypothetical protein [Oligoflexia bacterium]
MDVTALEQLALDLIPERERLEAARKRAEACRQHASAAKALTTARDYAELTATRESGADLARARLLEAIALRRLTRLEEARAKYREAEAALESLPLEKTGPLRAELLLERAIEAFVREDHLESARLNERAANVALATGHGHEGARALLNAAVSWDRVGERAETAQALARGRETLARLARTPLHTSFELFAWRQELDQGPVPATFPVAPEDATQSQKTLFALYGLEHALYARTHAEAQRLREALTTRVRDLGERQFDTEIRALETASALLFEGRRAEGLPSLCALLGALSPRAKASPASSSSPAVLPVLAGGWLRFCLLQGKWKSLQELARLACESPHPVTRAWGARSEGWLALRQGQVTEARARFAAALTLARAHHLTHLHAQLEAELSFCDGRASEAPAGLTPWEARALERVRALRPGAGTRFLRVAPGESRATLEETAALAELDREPAPGSDSPLLIDGVRLCVREKGLSSNLETKPVQKRLLFALLAAYPRNVSKEELIGLVWDEVYNPLVHDAVFHRAVSRLRRLTPTLSSEIVSEAGGLRWKGHRPFLAFIPEHQRDRQLARLSPRQIRMLTLLKYQGKLSRGEVVRALKVSERTVVRELALLMDRKLLLRAGQGPATVYYPAH